MKNSGQPSIKPAVLPRRRWRGLRTALAATALSAGVVGAGAANLGEIYAMALEGDAQFAAARAAAAAGFEKSAQGRAGLRPHIDLGGHYKRVRESGGSAATTDPRYYNTSEAGLTLTQPLFRKVNWETYQQGELQAQLAGQQLRLAEQDLILRVARGYFEVLQAQDVLMAVAAQKDAFAQQAAQARRGTEVGLASITDLNEAQARLDLTLAQEIAARNELENKRSTLEKAIARELPPLAPLAEQSPVDIIAPARLRAMVASAPESALQVGAAELGEQIARRELARQEASALPTADLVAGLNRTRNGNFVTQGPNSLRQVSIGLDVRFGVYQGGATASRVREAAALLERAHQELLNARQQARLDARQAYHGVSSGSALNEALRKALASSETQMRSTRRGLEVGTRTRVDVLNAEQQWYATRKDLAVSRYQTLVAGLQLKAAAGDLAPQDLYLLDGLLAQAR